MKTAAGRQYRWAYAVAGACVGLVVLSLLFRAPGGPRVRPLQPAKTPGSAVRLVSLKPNEAALTDPTPLFLPTEWNSGQNALPANTQREPGGSFQGYSAKLAFAETELNLNLPAAIKVPARPADALAAERSGQSFLGLGQSDHPVSQLNARKAFIEILAAINGQRLLAQPLTNANPPGGAWQPMEFLVAVDAMGLVGPPTLTESSRVAAVDGYFQNYLVKTLHAGQRLTPGFYRICIGP
ncbi:MAG: hypothetical protein DUW69_001634 [Verrucomicrobia bacterium]|jgi:hypothetical protein|nr:MAG: hypothetical protein DUW69_001634 [Verrucomicrobiota bacterium]